MQHPDIPVTLTAKEKLEIIWSHLRSKNQNNVRDCSSEQSEKRQWPSYHEVLQDIRKSDYNEILTCPLDFHPGEPRKSKTKMEFNLSKRLSTEPSPASRQTGTSMSHKKTICAQGAVCTAKLELFEFPRDTINGRPYSGLLKPGTIVEHCLVRLSSTVQPLGMGSNKRMAKMMFGEKLASAKIFPGVAIKMFRSRQHSGNVLFLGSKVGQPETDFFSHCLCTQITSRMPVALKPILQTFRRYSQHPMALGLSDLCMYDKYGDVAADLNFPFCLTLHPHVRSKGSLDQDLTVNDMSEAAMVDRFLDDIQQIPEGTVLYDVFASPDPKSVACPNQLQRIGKIVSTSAMQKSPNDDGLFFRHQKKDEDLALRPDWIGELGTQVALKDGGKGTAATLSGWELFENQIQDGDYVDFEKASQ